MANEGSNWLFKTLPFCCLRYRNKAWAQHKFVNFAYKKDAAGNWEINRKRGRTGRLGSNAQV